MDAPPGSQEGQSPVDRLAEEFLERRRSGERPSIEDFACAHPDLAGEIREVFPSLVFLEGLREEETPAHGAVAPDRDRVAPSKVGDYRILREVGRGGMGIVYEAIQESLGRRVALKVLPGHSRLDDRQRERFRREAQAAARLHHTNIVPVHETGEHEGIHYYSMEFIEGEGLDEVLEREREQPMRRHASRTEYFRRIAAIGVQAADALAFAHERGVLHRDVKPSNLLLDSRGTVWITDFGLARVEGSSGLTQSGEILGTLRFMAPECLDGTVDSRGDIYSLGITLYEALTLRPAFDETVRSRLMRAIVETSPPRLQKIDETIPRDLETIVARAIEKDPRRRYASAGELAEDLRRFLAGLPPRAREVTALEHGWRWCRRKPVVASLTLAVAVLTIVTAVTSTIMTVRLRETLREAYLSQAQAMRWSGRIGRRFATLEAVREAAGIRASIDLRNEAIAAMALADLRVGRDWELPSGARAIRFDREMGRYAVADESGMVTVCTAADGKVLLRLRGPDIPAYAVRFDPTGRRLAVKYGHGGTPVRPFRLWELDTGEARLELDDGLSNHAVAFSPDGRRLALGFDDGTIRLHDVETAGEIMRLPLDGRPHSLEFTPDGRRLAISATERSEGELRVIDLLTRKSIFSAHHHGGKVTGISWHPGGHLLAAACEDRKVYVWAVPGKAWRVLTGHQAVVTQVTFHPDGNLLASTGWDRRILIWDVLGSEKLLDLPGRHVRFGSDGRSLARQDVATASVLEVTTASECRHLHDRMQTGKGLHFVSVSPDSRWLAATGDFGARIWAIPEGNDVGYVPYHELNAAIFAPDGRTLVTIGKRGIHAWPIEEVARGLRLGPSQAIWQLGRIGPFSVGPLGDAVAVVAGRDVYVVELREPFTTTKVDGLEAREAAMSPDGRWIAGLEGGGIRVRDRREGRVALDLSGEKGRAEFSPDGRWLVIATASEYRFLEVGSWRIRHRVSRQGSESPGPIAFAPDGALAVLVAGRTIIQLVDPAGGVELATFEPPRPLLIYDLCLSADGRYLAAGTTDHVVELWDLRALGEGLAPLGLDHGWPARPGASATAPRDSGARSPVREPAPRLPNPNFLGTAGSIEGNVVGAVPDYWYAYTSDRKRLEVEPLALDAGALFPESPATGAVRMRVLAPGGRSGLTNFSHRMAVMPGRDYRVRFRARSANAEGSAQRFRLYFYFMGGPPQPWGPRLAEVAASEDGFTATAEWRQFTTPDFQHEEAGSACMSWELVEDGGEDAVEIALPEVEELVFPSDVSCTRTDVSVKLAWRNHAVYETLRVVRDGELLATLAGNAASHVDREAPEGPCAYAIEAAVLDLRGGAECEVAGIAR